MARDYLMFFRNRTSPAASSRTASDGAGQVLPAGWVGYFFFFRA